MLTTRIQTVNGREDAVLDTGAWLSYADGRAVEGRTPIRTDNDFILGLGDFNTPVYRVPIVLDGVLFEPEFGVLPPAATAVMSLLDLPNWIIGSFFFTDRPTVLDIEGRRLYRQRSYSRRAAEARRNGSKVGK